MLDRERACRRAGIGHEGAVSYGLETPNADQAVNLQAIRPPSDKRRSAPGVPTMMDIAESREGLRDRFSSRGGGHHAVFFGTRTFSRPRDAGGGRLGCERQSLAKPGLHRGQRRPHCPAWLLQHIARQLRQRPSPSTPKRPSVVCSVFRADCDLSARTCVVNLSAVLRGPGFQTGGLS
jgi:hypothetical protein